MFIAGLVGINYILIFASWRWAKLYYIYLPFVAFPLVLNCCMIASIAFFKLRNSIWPEKTVELDHAESLVLLLPCYNETVEECTRSLDSLVDQVGIDDNKTAILVVCDGRVRGPNMQKTTANYLIEDILVDQTSREKIRDAYRAWDSRRMDIEVCRGRYKGVPFYCVVKEQNMGKRDSLIVARSFLYKFNIRRTSPDTIFSPRFLRSMSDWLAHDALMDQVDNLIGMDADTVFDKDCIAHLLNESRYPGTVGVCGYVTVDFSGGNWNPWSLYQNAEYTLAQGLRRLHQSIATKKVSCLPGCCQLLKICEYTCGDRVLLDLFAYHPTPLDNIVKQIRATASEDRNHVCLMLTTYPAAQTRQALRARAFTDVPHSWTVFLSQRRRWTLGATGNDLMLLLARHCQWWERILALSNVMVWCLNVFVIASIGCMVVAFISQPVWIIMAFVGVMMIPIVYYLVMAIWMPRTTLERVQYLAGLLIFVVLGPFLNICVMLFAIWNMDSFGWGKTRLVVTDDDEKPSTGGSTRQSRGHDEESNVGMVAEKQTMPPCLPRAQQA
ncbi:chitin synthase domain-containing protein [Hirsutella rhossiliensis]|uniref:chitin synthase n=1 Tax=Hirsutella rhossiliensis TaxID=111463 RepID=A0A9P8SLX8_9HYPO|nr:chitin synthase domain-containing protein [Hirsutella rhossiliensis]KAH0967983.1 chitin synthase domain-containing protein [Hirsutella rhossiliensis]